MEYFFKINKRTCTIIQDIRVPHPPYPRPLNQYFSNYLTQFDARFWPFFKTERPAVKNRPEMETLVIRLHAFNRVFLYFGNSNNSNNTRIKWS